MAGASPAEGASARARVIRGASPAGCGATPLLRGAPATRHRRLKCNRSEPWGISCCLVGVQRSPGLFFSRRRPGCPGFRCWHGRQHCFRHVLHSYQRLVTSCVGLSLRRWPTGPQAASPEAAGWTSLGLPARPVFGPHGKIASIRRYFGNLNFLNFFKTFLKL